MFSWISLLLTHITSQVKSFQTNLGTLHFIRHIQEILLIIYVYLHHEKVADRKTHNLEGIFKLKNQSIAMSLKHRKCTELQFGAATISSM